MSETPMTREGLQKYDHLPPAEAVRKAWHDAGLRPQWHARKQDELRKTMPLLARALDRL